MSRLTGAEEIRAGVDASVRTALDLTAERLRTQSPVADELTEVLGRFLSRGKRVRSIAMWWGHQIATATGPGAGPHDPAGLSEVAASIEMLHAAALVHDDIIDASPTRRGEPAVHAHFAKAHAERSWAGDSELYGTGTAIIAGDLCLSLSEEYFTRSGLPTLASAPVIRIHDDFRRDVMLGQFLDVRLEAADVADEEIAERAWEVLTYKSAKYSVEQPFLLGAALGGADEELLARLSAFGLPLGQAFQMRDDVLGAFGDPSVTGKPAGDDLVRGKKTVLVGYTLQALAPADRARFTEVFGNPHANGADVDLMRGLIEDSGALESFTRTIDTSLGEALGAIDALDGLDGEDRGTLRDFAHYLTARAA